MTRRDMIRAVLLAPLAAIVPTKPLDPGHQTTGIFVTGESNMPLENGGNVRSWNLQAVTLDAPPSMEMWIDYFLYKFPEIANSPRIKNTIRTSTQFTAYPPKQLPSGNGRLVFSQDVYVAYADVPATTSPGEFQTLIQITPSPITDQ